MIYTPLLTSVDEVCAILASGKNVVTTAFLFHPQRMAEADRDRLLAACEKGRSSVHGGGLNPGNLSGVLPLALSGMSHTIDKITLQERADWSVYDSTAITFEHVGAIEDAARARGLAAVDLHAQTHALGFYERLGYVAYGPEFPDAGMPHRAMRKAL